MGLGCIVLGAGRKVSSDKIDFATGLEILVKDGERVKKGDTLFIMHANDSKKLVEAEEFFNSSLEITDHAHSPIPLIAKVLQ
jgi:thymidine phosphorylase